MIDLFGTAFMALLAIVGAIFYGTRQERKGRKEATTEIRRRADVAAQDRKETRDEIDDDVRQSGAADELRNEWSRD